MLPTATMLVIDLTTKTVREETIPERVMRDYLGGRGLGAYLLYQHTRAGLDPLSPENPLIFTAGYAQGMSTPFSPKVVLTTKSPQTGLYLYSLSSGTCGHSIRKAGYLAVMITGKAAAPVYLSIVNGSVEFCDAGSLWGMKTLAAQDAMVQASGAKGASTIAIGPAGEKLVRYAAVMTDGKLFRAFGRSGAGCVMGAKNLKGIIISGANTVTPADPEKFTEVKRKIAAALKDNRAWAENRRKYGTGEDMPEMNEWGMLPTRNWQTGVLEGDTLSGIAPTLNEKQWPRKNIACGPYCPNPCSHHITIGAGPYAGAACDGPEYETMYVFGSNCGIGKFDAVVAASELCDEYGIDTISAGLTVSFLMECFEKGLIDTSHTDGLKLQFGDDAALMEALRKIASREGAGYLWGEGARRLAAEIPGSEAFAMHCKGLEMGGYECRAFFGQALAFALNSKGGDHHGLGLPARLEAADGTNLEIKGKGMLVKKEAVGRIVADSLVVCCFPRKMTAPIFGDLIEAVAGLALSRTDLEDIGLRILTQERLFNTREGMRRTDDTLPERLLSEPLPDGPYRGSTVPLEALKDDAYAALEWNRETGVPEPALLERLGIKA